MIISEHITFKEATQSQTAVRNGIDNTPNLEVTKAMISVAKNCFEPIRLWYGKPITISSFYRCERLNKLIGGSETSQHCKGEAIDMDTGIKEENEKIFNWAKENLDFDQLINEYDYSWVHISYKVKGNRKQILIVK